MTRFFMSIREAVQLVLQAAAMSAGRDVFVLEMGEQVRILDLAQRMIRLSGRHVGDVEIRMTGVRPGEKLIEELHAPDEKLHPTDHSAIRRLYPATMSWIDLGAALDRLETTVATGDDAGAKAELFQLTTTASQPLPDQVSVAR